MQQFWHELPKYIKLAIPIIGVISLFATFIYQGYRSEKIAYNNGIDPVSGQPWRHAWTDSQGHRRYESQDGKRWINVWFSKVDNNSGHYDPQLGVYRAKTPLGTFYEVKKR